jgi:DNA-binding NtrC family response regulator
VTHEAPPKPRASLRELSQAFGTVTDLLLDRGVGLEEAVSAFSTGYVRSAVARHGGNLSQAAAALRIHRNTLRVKMQRNGHRPSRGR